MKKNGFTLVELLGVIIILSLLVLLVLPSITNSIKDYSTKTDNVTKEIIYNASELFISNHSSHFPKIEGKKYAIELKDLIDEGYLSSPILTSDKKDITNEKCIQITYKNGFKYELKDKGQCAAICSLEDVDNNGIVNLSDIVTCGTENFYVMESTQNKVTMLSQYNITLSTTNPVQDSSDISYPAKNTVPFSSNIYWSSDGYSPAGNSSYNYVYDSNSNLYLYIEAYKKVLERMGLNIIDAKLMSYEQATTLGCSITSGIYCSSAPDWMGLTTYWLGSATDDGVSGINKGGYFSFFVIENSNEFDDVFGIRPVITISKYDIGR